MSQTAETLPSISFDENLGQYIEFFDIHFGKFQRGIEDLGVPVEISADTSMHFSDIGPERHFGVSFGGGTWENLSFKTPWLNKELLTTQGFRSHQASYFEKVAINLNPNVPRALKKTFIETHDVSPKKMRGFSPGDLVALVMAHELGHTLPANRGRIFTKRAQESRIGKYIAKCIQKGRDNPWLGVVDLRYK